MATLEKTKTVSPEEFVTIWQSAKSIKEVCEKTNLTEDGAYARARYYKKHNVRLKRFGRPKTKVDWVKLAKIAGELGGDIGKQR